LFLSLPSGFLRLLKCLSAFSSLRPPCYFKTDMCDSENEKGPQGGPKKAEKGPWASETPQMAPTLDICVEEAAAPLTSLPLIPISSSGLAGPTPMMAMAWTGEMMQSGFPLVQQGLFPLLATPSPSEIQSHTTMPLPCSPLPSVPFSLSPLPIPTFMELQKTYTLSLCSSNKSKIPKMPQILPEKSEESLGQKTAQTSRIAQIPGEILAETSAQTVSPPEIERSYGSGVVGLPGATLAAGGLSPPPQGYQSWPQSTTRGHPPALPAPMPVPRQPAADRCKGGDVEGRSHGSRGCNFPDGTFAAPSPPH
jgi:hypothetical protein